MPITERQHDYAHQIQAEMEQHNIRVEVDLRSEKIGYKIREGQLQKIPYLLILGDKELEAQSVAVRHRKEGDLGAMPLADFVKRVKTEIEKKSL